MTFGTVASGRVFAGVGAAVLAAALATPGVAVASSLDPDLMATIELSDGDIEYALEPGTLHFFDEENAPFAIEVIDGCAVDDHYWIFGAGLSGVPVNVTITDLNTGKHERVALPPFEPGVPIGTVMEPGALALCTGGPQGGLPELDGTAVYSTANNRGADGTIAVELRSEGRDDAYRRLVRDGASSTIISKGSPIVAIDESDTMDQLSLIAEGRTPRQLEGVVFSGEKGMLPSRAALEKALKPVTKARVRRAFETAKGGRVPQAIIEDLGLKRVDRVHHMSLTFDTLGADHYLAEAGWLREGGAPIESPQLVDGRFTVEIVRADGERMPVPLVGPFVGSDAEGSRWNYAASGAIIGIIDACDLGGTFWTWAGVRTTEPVELEVTDTTSGTTATHIVWTDRRDVSRMADTASLPTCP